MTLLKKNWDFIKLHDRISTFILGVLATVLIGILGSLQLCEHDKKTEKIRVDIISEIETIKHSFSPEVNNVVNQLKYPKTADDFFIKAYAATLDKNYDKAIEYFHKSIELDPSRSSVYTNLGAVYSDKINPDYDKAIEYHKKAIDINPKNEIAYSNLGNAYINGYEDYNTAMKYYEKAIQINPDFPLVYFNIGTAYQEGKENYNKAIECYKKAIDIGYDDADIYSNIGTCYQLMEDYNTAIIYYENSIALNPKYVRAYCNLGAAYTDKINPDYDKALEYYLTALSLNPDNEIMAIVSWNMGDLYGKKGNKELEKKFYKQAAQLGDEYAIQWFTEHNISWKN